jgi:hypothetical protein
MFAVGGIGRFFIWTLGGNNLTRMEELWTFPT